MTTKNEDPQLVAEPLAITVKGEVLSSNLTEFQEMVRAALGSINRDLKTSADFGRADQDAKALKVAEQNVRDAKDKALADAEAIASTFTQLDETAEEIRAVRLELEKLIAKRKKEVLGEAVDQTERDLAEHDITVPRSELEDVIKGKRSLKGIRQALDIHAANTIARVGKVRGILDQFEGEHGADMIRDRQQLESRTPDQVSAELRRRLELHQAEQQRKAEKEEADRKLAEAKAEAAQAVAAAKGGSAPESKPAEPATIQVGGPRDLDPVEAGREWRDFEQTLVSSFAPLKQARAALRDKGNQERAAKFAAAVTSAWNEMRQTT